MSQGEPSHSIFPRGRVRIVVLLAVLLILPSGAWYGFQWFRDFRAEQLANQAWELLEAGPDSAAIREAGEKSRAAYQLRPENLRVVRLTAKCQELLDPHLAPDFWEQAIELSGGELRDRFALVRAAQRVGQFERSGDALAWLKEHAPTRIDTVYLMSRQALLQARIPEALDRSRELKEHPDAEWEHHQHYIQVTQYSDTLEVREEGISHLFDLAAGSGEIALQAARQSVNVPEMSAEEYRQMADHLQRLAAGRDDRLLAWQLQRRAGEPASEIVSGLSGIFDLEKTGERVEMGRWLNQNGMYLQALELIGESMAIRRQDLFLVRADALAYTGRWRELQDMLSRTQVPLDNYVGHLFRMRAHLELQDFRRARVSWERAMLDAGRDAQRLWFLERYVHRLRLDDYREEVLGILCGIPLQARRAFTELLRLLQAQGRTEEVLQRLNEMQELFPEDPDIRNDRLYYRLLLQVDVAGDLEEAKELVESNPDFLAPHMTYALALFRGGDVSAALTQLQQLEVDWNLISERWKVLLASLLAANGDRRWGERYLDGIDLTRLLPEERDLIQEAFGE